MITVSIRLYEELNRVLPQAERKKAIDRMVPNGSTLRHLLSILGLFPEDIDLALVNSRSVSLDHVLGPQDRVSLYPEFESLDIRGVSAVRDIPLRNPRFVAQSSLRGLAGLLRDMGYDCICPDRALKADLARMSRQEKRILLTSDPDMARSFALDRCVHVQSTRPEGQLQEVVHRFQLGKVAVQAP